MILERERIEGLETIKRALERYGSTNQMLKCIEEMGELSRALARALNPYEQTDHTNICEDEGHLEDRHTGGVDRGEGNHMPRVRCADRVREIEAGEIHTM